MVVELARRLILLIFCVPSSLAICKCIGTSEDPIRHTCIGEYRGSSAQCACQSNQYAARAQWVSWTYQYVPSGSFSTGGCVACGNTAAELGQSEEGGSEVPHPEEMLVGNVSVSQSFVRQNVTKNLGEGPVKNFNACYCSGQSFGKCPNYYGSIDDCLRYVDLTAKSHAMENYKYTYYPWGSFSAGGCSVCGMVDPCTA